MQVFFNILKKIIGPRGCGGIRARARDRFSCTVIGKSSSNGLVVEYIVTIDGIRVQFPGVCVCVCVRVCVVQGSKNNQNFVKFIKIHHFLKFSIKIYKKS